jgi:hypothetical protein
MEKPTRPHIRLDPQLLTVVVAAVVVLIALVSAAAIGRLSAHPAPRPTPSPVPQAVLPQDGHVISITGQYVCLPHKNTSGPQTDECAFGLKDAHNVYYGLRDSTSDYSLVSGLTTGKTVQVTGTFQRQDSDMYPSVGTILVTAVNQQ